MHDFSAWIDTWLLKPNSIHEDAFQEFNSRFTGFLREWFKGLDLHKSIALDKIKNHWLTP